MILLLVVYCLALGSTNLARAQERRTDLNPPINEVDQLSRASYADRQQATLEMWRVRDQSRDRVQRAANHPDPEIAGRAQWILRQWRRGSLPGTPPEISRLLAKYPGAAGINQLLVGGQFAAARVAIEESFGTAEFESIQQRVHMTLLGRFPACIHAGMKHGSLPDLVDLIDTIASSKEEAISRIELIRELGMDVEALGLLPKSASQWSESERVEAKALVLISLGRFDESIEVAQQGTDQTFLYNCRAIAGQWQAAMNEALANARASEPGSAEHARSWSRVMFCADHANETEVFAQAITELATADLTDNSSARDLRWRTLASHGKIDMAIDMLDRFDHETSAELAIAASRVEHVFEVLDFPLEEADTRVDEWIEFAIESQRTLQAKDSKQNALADPVSELLIVIRALTLVGREDIAHPIVQRLCATDLAIGNLKLRDHVLDSLRFTPRRDWIVEFAIADGEKAVTQTVKGILLQSLYKEDSNSFDLIIEALTLVNRSQKNAKVRIANAYTLMQGEIPAGLDESTYFKKLHDLAIMPGRASGRRIPGQFPAFARGRVRGTMGLVEFFLQHGHAEHANAIIRKLAETGNQDALLLLAEQELDAGSTELAEVLFDSLSETVFDRAAGIVIGNTRSDELAIKSLIGLWRIAKRNGDIQRSEELFTEIRLALNTPSTRLRNSIAQYLVDRKEHPLAVEVFERLLPIAIFENEERTGIFSVARHYSPFMSDTDAAKAARWFDLGAHEMARTGVLSTSSNVTNSIYVQRWSLEASIERRDEPAINRHIDRVLALDPLNIALAEGILPKLREQGWKELADQTLDRIVQFGLGYCQNFPEDATIANNLAWVAAMNGQHLETALELSEQAVYLEPESAIYRDTLAEILFRLGRIDEALHVEEACLLDDPTDWHIHQQVDKYRNAGGQ